MRHLLFLAAIPVLIGAAAPAAETGFAVQGSKPKWRMTIAGNRIWLVQPGPRKRGGRDGDIGPVERSPGHVRFSATMYEPQLAPVGHGRDGRPVYWVEYETWPLSVDIAETPCTDAQRRSFPTTVTIADSDGELRGCGGSLAELEAGLVAKP
jgi:hypothetical protein